MQLCAGMWEFKVGNSLGAMFFTSYAGFWMSYAAIFINCFGFLNGYSTYANGPKDLHDGLGLYLLAWTMFTILNAIAAHRTTLALLSLILIVMVALLFLSIHHFTIYTYPEVSIRCQEVGGVFGVIGSFLAWYGAFATLLTKKNSLVILPVVPLDPIWKAWGMLPADAEGGH